MSDTLDAAQPDGGPASSDPGYAASPGYIRDGSSRYAPPPSARPAPPSPEPHQTSRSGSGRSPYSPLCSALRSPEVRSERQ